MESNLGHEYVTLDSRRQFLEDNCDAIEIIGYTRRFTLDELTEKKDELAKLVIELNNIEVEKKTIMDEIKARMKPLDTEKEALIKDIRNQSEFIEGKCYKFIDHDNKEVGYYDELGELVSSRPIMRQEMQKTIFSISKATGTED